MSARTSPSASNSALNREFRTRVRTYSPATLQVCARGLGAGLLALGLALSAPAYAQVSSAPLGEVDPWGVGWLGRSDGALPSSLWANTTTSTLVPLFAAAQPQQLAPSARLALRRLILSSAKGPLDIKPPPEPKPAPEPKPTPEIRPGPQAKPPAAGAKPAKTTPLPPQPMDAGALISERLRIMEQLGESEHALDLRKRFPETAWGKSHERMTADFELLLGQSKSACGRAADKRGDDVAWMPVRAFCFALAGDFNAASLGAEHIPAPEDGTPGDGWLVLAIATMEAPAKARPEGRYGAPLETAVSIAAKLPVPANAMVGTPADIAAALIAHPDATLEQKRAALRPALDGGRIKAEQVVEVLSAKEPVKEGAKPASPRSVPRADFLALALAAAGNKDAKTDAKATAYAAALKAAETISDFRLAATALAASIAALPKNAQTLPNAETFARVALLAGDTKTTQDWRKLMDTAARDKADPWAAARIDMMLAYSGVGAEKAGVILDRLIASAPAATEGAAKAATPQSRQIDLRRIETTRFLFLHAGMGRDLSPVQRSLLGAQRSAGRGVSDAMLARIAAAADQDADGEAAMSAIALLGPDVSALSFAGLCDLLIQLRRIGLEDNANAIALESLQVWKAL